MSSIIKSHRIVGERSIALGKQTAVAITLQEEVSQEQIIEEEKKVECLQILEEARLEGERLRIEAEEQVERLRLEVEKEAKAQADLIKEEATLIEEEARWKAQEMIEAAQKEAASIVDEAYRVKEQIINEAEPEIITLVQKLVGHIIHEEISSHTNWVRLLVKKIFQYETITEPVRLMINPELYNKMTDDEKQAIRNMGDGVEIKIDENYTSTLCQIETNQGSISYDINEGLEKVLRELAVLQSL